MFGSDIRDLQSVTHQRTQLLSVREDLLISPLEFGRNKSNSLCWCGSRPSIRMHLLLYHSLCTTISLFNVFLYSYFICCCSDHYPPFQLPQRLSSLLTWETGSWKCEWRRTSRWTTTGGTACEPSEMWRKHHCMSTSSLPPRRRLLLTDTFICSLTASYS